MNLGIFFVFRARGKICVGENFVIAKSVKAVESFLATAAPYAFGMKTLEFLDLENQENIVLSFVFVFCFEKRR
jgi:hypothetical protein